MLESSLKGETWGLLHLFQPPILVSCLWRKLMWFFPWRNLMWFFPDKWNSAVSFLLLVCKLFGTLRKKDFLLHWAQTNILSLSSLIHILRSALDFHIMFILLYLLLSFSGFMSGCLQFFCTELGTFILPFGGQVTKDLTVLINCPVLSWPWDSFEICLKHFGVSWGF